MNYIALIHKDARSDYGVSFPDFPGCITAGKTLDEAKDLAQEALKGHVNLMKEMEETIPAPSSLESIMKDLNNKDSVAFLVEAPLARIVRVNVSFSEDTLHYIDEQAQKRHMSRSAYLASLALGNERNVSV